MKPKVSEKTSHKGLKTNGKGGCVLLEKNDKKKRVLNDVSVSPTKPVELGKGKDRKRRDAGISHAVRDDNAKANMKAINKCMVNLEDIKVEVDLQLPRGTLLTTLFGIELPPEEMGHALQFLEFCGTFGKVFFFLLRLDAVLLFSVVLFEQTLNIYL